MYNNTKEIQYDETLDIVARILFLTSAVFTLIEIVAFYFKKVAGQNIEVHKTGKPKVNRLAVWRIGVVSLMACLAAVLVGFFVFETKNCLDNWFVEDDAICQSCVLYLGEECLSCTNSTVCDSCATGYFFVTENTDDLTALGIDSATETRCRSCQSLWGSYCTECSATGCTNSTTDSFIADNVVIVCSEVFGV